MAANYGSAEGDTLVCNHRNEQWQILFYIPAAPALMEL